VNATKIRELQEKLETAKRKKAEAEGAIKQLLSSLSDLGVKTVKEARAEEKKLDAEVAIMERQIEKKAKELSDVFYDSTLEE